MTINIATDGEWPSDEDVNRTIDYVQIAWRGHSELCTFKSESPYASDNPCPNTPESNGLTKGSKYTSYPVARIVSQLPLIINS